MKGLKHGGHAGVRFSYLVYNNLPAIPNGRAAFDLYIICYTFLLAEFHRDHW